MISGIVYKIQRFSLLDGPGIRTAVFLKGCPLRCKWCFNPESHTPEPEMIFSAQKCIGCYRCLLACGFGAVREGAGIYRVRRELCTACGKCEEVCPGLALRRVGERMTAEQVADEAERDRAFYRRDGGITLTGGEAAMQPEFAREILRLCRERRIHTALETCGFVKSEVLDSLLARTDYVLFDIKAFDSGLHKTLTGVGNALILENAVRLDATGIAYIIRIPVIPGCNDQDADLEKTAEFIRSKLPRARAVQLEPYESVGVGKYACLGRTYELPEAQTPSDDRIAAIASIFAEKGLNVQIGG